MPNDPPGPAVSAVSIALSGGWSGRVLVEDRAASPARAGGGGLPDCGSWRPWLEQLIAHPADLPGYSVLKFSKTAEVFRAGLAWSGGANDRRMDVICKRATIGGFGRGLLARWRPSRARRNFDRGLALLRAGIGTALPLATLERRARPGEAWLVTEHLADLVDLDLVVLTRLPRLDSRQSFKVKSALLDAVIELFSRLASLGLHHRDLKASNILIANWDDPGQGLRAVLVDLDGLRRRRWWRPSERRQPLIRLAASLLGYPAITRTDHLRFLRRYLPPTGRGGAQWKAHFRSLARGATRYANRAQGRKTHKLDGHTGSRPGE